MKNNKFKTCYKCKKCKPILDFSWKNKLKNLYSEICKECQRIYTKKHYINNKDIYKKRAIINNKKYIKRAKKFIFQYLLSNPCINCGETNIITLDFDHIDENKELEISRMVFMGMSIKSITKEIKKCEIRCSNCHRKRHAKEINSWKYIMQQNNKLE